MKESNIVEGKYRRNIKGFGFVKIEGQDEEIHVSKEYSSYALDGDIVRVKLLEAKEGKIIKIIKHENNTIVGTFQKNKNFGFVVPDNKSLGTDIFISKNNYGKARNNHKVIVQITKYPEKGKNAEGKIVKVIGRINEAGVDMLSLISEYNLPSKFSEEVVEEAKLKGDKVNLDEIKNRVDLRKEEIFTIDGEDAKDLDDAVCVKKLKDGNYMLDVHIADVSHYVNQDTLLDKEAYIRGTSIYMLGRVIPMLPRELSNGICSLNEGEDRLTLSCSMEIDKNGKVIDSKVYKSVIKVTRRMSYTDVQKILDKSDKEVVEKYKDYIEHFNLMAELATILKTRRTEQGYLNLDIPESKIELDVNGFAINVKKYETTFANEIIEQFMLTANETIAEKFYWLEAPFVYRVHEVPDMEKISELNKFLFNLGLKIKASKDNIHSKAFENVLEKVKGKPEEKVVSNLILRTLKLARYETENKGHFGIASNYYCHFTSPIRRYPDLFIHRIISKYLESNYNVSEEYIDKYNKISKDVADNSSEREKVATKVEREAEKIKKAEYMKTKIGEVYDGIVSSITSFGMFVELENTVEGFIGFDSMGSDEYFIFDEKNRTLTGEHTKNTFKIGDKVKIKVKSASKILRQIDFEIIKEDLTTENV